MNERMVRHDHSAVGVVRFDVGGELDLPTIAVEQQLLLVVEELLARLRRVLEVGPLDDRVHWARLLAEATEDALCHVDIVARRASRAVSARLRIDCDRLQRTIVRIVQYMSMSSRKLMSNHYAEPTESENAWFTDTTYIGFTLSQVHSTQQANL